MKLPGATHLVVLARHLGTRIETFIIEKLENWLGLKFNRQKTRIVKLRSTEERLEFLGYQLGLAPDLRTRQHCYWRLEPSAKALRRELDKLKDMTAIQHGQQPLPEFDRQTQSSPQRLGQLLSVWSSSDCLSQGQLLRPYPALPALRRRSQRAWRSA